MHEMAILGNVMDVVLEHALTANATEVIKVSLVVGELRDVVDELMESCFQFLARGTIAANAELEITKVPLKVRCKHCDLAFPANMHDKDTMVCPICGRADLSILAGREFIISGIEIR